MSGGRRVECGADRAFRLRDIQPQHRGRAGEHSARHRDHGGWSDGGEFTGASLTDDEFTFAGDTYEIHAIYVAAETLLLQFDVTNAGDITTAATRNKLTLHVGSDLVSLAGRGTARRPTGNTLDQHWPHLGRQRRRLPGADGQLHHHPHDHQHRADDYTLSSTTITLAEGETAGTVTITVTDYAEDDDGETIVLDAASTSPALTADPLTLTIEDNDVTPVPALPLLGQLLLALGLAGAGARLLSRRRACHPWRSGRGGGPPAGWRSRQRPGGG